MASAKSKTRMIVRYRNELYDITDFMKNHPGGSNTLNSMLHADIDYKFDEGMPHSPAARYLMREYKLSSITSDDDPTSQSFYSDKSPVQFGNSINNNNSNSNNNNTNNHGNNSNNKGGQFDSNDDIQVHTDESMEVSEKQFLSSSVGTNH